MPASFFDLKFPSNQNLGLRLEPHILIYSLGRSQHQTECVVVTESSLISDIWAGDIVVSVNGLPTINNIVPAGMSHLSASVEILGSQQNMPRVLRFLRNSSRFDPSYKTTVIVLSNDDGELIFHNFISPAATSNNGGDRVHEHNNIARRVDEHLYRMQTERHDQRKADDAASYLEFERKRVDDA